MAVYTKKQHKKRLAFAQEILELCLDITSSNDLGPQREEVLRGKSENGLVYEISFVMTFRTRGFMTVSWGRKGEKMGRINIQFNLKKSKVVDSSKFDILGRYKNQGHIQWNHSLMPSSIGTEEETRFLTDAGNAIKSVKSWTKKSSSTSLFFNKQRSTTI